MTSLLSNLSSFLVNAKHLNACISVFCQSNKTEIVRVAKKTLSGKKCFPHFRKMSNHLSLGCLHWPVQHSTILGGGGGGGRGGGGYDD